MQQTWLRVVLISLYVVIFVLGVAGNSLVVYIVLLLLLIRAVVETFVKDWRPRPRPCQ